MYTIIVMMTTRPEWLALNHAERNEFNETYVNPIIARYAEKVRVRLCDAEAFTGRCTDFALFETTDLTQYYYLMEELRDSPLFGKPYFDVNEIIVGLEGGFSSFEQMLQERAANES